MPTPEPLLPLEERFRRLGGGLFTVHLVTVFGIALSNVFFALTAISLPWSKAWKTADHRRLRPIWIALGLYLLCLVASASASWEPWISWSAAVREIVLLATLALALILVRGEREVRRVVGYLILFGALFALVGLVQFFWGFGDIEQRIRGPFSHYMTFAGILLVCDLLLLAKMVVGEGWRRPWLWVAMVLVNLGLVGSLTRGAWVALILVGTALLAALRPRWLAWCMPLALVALIVMPVPVVQRAISIFDLRDPSNYDRICMTDAGLLMIRDRPALGIGPGLVSRWYPIYRHATAPRFSTPHLHSSFLELGASSGLATLAAYLGLMGVAAFEAWRRYREEGGADGPRADLYLAVILALAAFNLAGLFEDNWADSEVKRIVLFVLALPFCLGQERLKDPEETETSRDRAEKPRRSTVSQ